MNLCYRLLVWGLVCCGSIPLTARAEPTALRVMTFNIRFATASDGPNAWPKRREMVFEVIQRFAPDLLGVQEALRMQLDEFCEQLPQYVAIGAGRAADGGGEYSSILFRRDRFDLWESGIFWLSDTPGVPGSTSWGNELPRICVWARLFDRQTNQTFTLFNTHWDHQSQPARERGGQLIAERVQARSVTDDPVIVMGDFNVGEGDVARQPFVTAGLRDSFRDLHSSATDTGTFHGFAGRTSGEKIDAILVSSHWRVVEAAIDHSNQAGRYPSDHFPVTAVLLNAE